jgi:hypothetical protein
VCRREPSNFTHGYICECGGGSLLSCDHVNSCLSSPCLNNATCTPNYYGYTCKCLSEKFTGKQCEYRLNALSTWSEWGEWGRCEADRQENENLCVQISTRQCALDQCRGANRRKRICPDAFDSTLDPCDRIKKLRKTIFSDFFVIFEHINHF